MFQSQKPNKIGVASISLPEIVKLVKDDEEYEMSLRLLLRAGDIMELYTAAYFNQSKLYISEVKVVCRSGGDKWGMINFLNDIFDILVSWFCYFSLFFHQYIYSRTSMTQTSLEPWKLIRDMGSLSHWGSVMVPSQEANGKFREVFSIFYTIMVWCVYSLELPWWGNSNENTQHTFHDKRRKFP